MSNFLIKSYKSIEYRKKHSSQRWFLLQIFYSCLFVRNRNKSRRSFDQSYLQHCLNTIKLYTKNLYNSSDFLYSPIVIIIYINNYIIYNYIII